jgi:hypothetical protein
MTNWRIDNARSLRGLKLRRSRYAPPSERWDHDHCAACWAKFAEFEGPGILHEGYTTCEDYKHGAGYDWVCDRCFSELKEEMGWSEAA